jgi:hypothetical protein
MLNLTGVLVNVYKSPAFISKDAQEGSQKPEDKDKLQILGDVGLKNGETRKDLLTVTVKNVQDYEGKEGSEISVPVGAFAPSKGSIIFFGL